MFKYGVHAFLWSADLDKDIPWVAEKAKRLGFDSLEMPLNIIDKVDVQLTRQALLDNGLECTCVGGLGKDQNLISPDPAVRRRGVDHLKRCIDIAAELGAPMFSGVIFAAWGSLVGRGRNDEEWRWSVEGLQAAAAYAAQAGIGLGLEPVNRFETYFLNTAADALKLVEEVGADNVGVLLDTFHVNIEEKSFYGAFKETGSRLVHVHACENDRGTPGSGLVRWHDVYRALLDIDYKGYIVIESFVPEIEPIARECAIWRHVAPGADHLAAEGLKYLKDVEQQVRSERAGG